MKITDFTSLKIKEILEIENDSFSTPWTEKMFTNELLNPLAHYYLLEDNGESVGYVGFWHIMDECHITNIAVKKAFRRKGYASALLNKVISYTEENNIVLITLEVRESNLGAQKLYEKFGFSSCGIRKNYYHNPAENAVIMTRS